jgi:hypothetical protein
MREIKAENFLARIVAWGTAFTTIFLISGSVTDPVNAPKFVSLGIVAMAAVLLLITSLKSRLRQNISLVLLSGTFFLFLLFSTFASNAPLSQILYGSYGRNNGLFTYLFLIFILLSAAAFRSFESFNLIIKALLVAGTINILYCFWVILFGDFVGWDNPYGNILGTLGNPNFIGAFLGIVFSSLFALVIDSNSSRKVRFFALGLLPVCAFEIIDSSAIQGRVVAVFGSSIVLFLYLRSRFNVYVLVAYSVATAFTGVIALMGALQMGPLTELIYKRSVSLRGQYWLAGWNTGQEHPFTGVGMDAFGDWYRRTRDVHALELPGVNTVVNAAHNVPLDIFAFGGWPLFVSYLLFVGLAGIALIKTIVRKKQFDLVLAILGSAWAGYQLQSIISINQIGLAVWGWLLGGALIGYERATRNKEQQSVSDDKLKRNTKKLKSDSSVPKDLILAAGGAACGLLIALPPLSADIAWRSAQLSRSVESIEKTMSPGYFNPQNLNKYLMNIQLLEQSNLQDLSHKYALEAVKWNPDSFDLWKIMFFIQKSTPDEKALAVSNMKRLDPLNPDVTQAR